MNSLTAFLAPLALLLPAGMADAPGLPLPPSDDALRLATEGGDAAGSPLQLGPESTAHLPLPDAAKPDQNAQVRIEQSITIRITPRPPRSDQEILASLPQGARPSAHIEERKIGSCVAAQGIVGVQTSDDNKLLLFMRDRRIISVALEKACTSRDFYSGFYIDRHDDGQLCAKRDKIHSRSGAKCELKQLRQLVAVRD